MAIEDTWEGEIYKDTRTAVENLPNILTEVERLAAIQTAVEKIPNAWSGTVYSNWLTATTLSVQRCESSETRVRRVLFINHDLGNDGLQSVSIGLYNANLTTFRDNSYRILPAHTATLQFVNLYTLGYAMTYDVAGTINISAVGSRE